MPTATDVDNRPVAIGKWPRLRNSRNGLNQHNRYHHHANNALRQRHGQAVSQNEHRQWCNLENCVHSCDESSNICTDVLLQPELLHELYGIDRSSSANPLLEFCLDGGGLSRKCMNDTFDLTTNQRTTEAITDLLQPCLLSHCSTCSEVSDTHDGTKSRFVAKLSMHLRQTGCDINVQDSKGLTPLHHLIQGCSKENFSTIMEAAELILSHADPNKDLVDSVEGDTVLSRLHVLLENRKKSQGLASSTLVPLVSLLAPKFDVNHINSQERTLLTYSVSLGDSALELTRCLLNHGAQVLPARSDILRDRSAFTWLLRSLMRAPNASLDSHRETLLLLCQNMCEMEAGGPENMRSHVLSTMVHLGHSASIMGPFFLQVRDICAPFWKQPLSLTHLCRSSIRHSLGPKNVAQGVTQLKLPPSLTQYLHYFHFQ